MTRSREPGRRDLLAVRREIDVALNAGGWVVDKRIPVATIGMMLLQTFAAVWWAASANERLKVQEAKSLVFEELFKERGKSLADLTQRTAATEAVVDTMRKQYESIDRKLDVIALERRK